VQELSALRSFAGGAPQGEITTFPRPPSRLWGAKSPILSPPRRPSNVGRKPAYIGRPLLDVTILLEADGCSFSAYLLQRDVERSSSICYQGTSRYVIPDRRPLFVCMLLVTCDTKWTFRLLIGIICRTRKVIKYSVRVRVNRQYLRLCIATVKAWAQRQKCRAGFTTRLTRLQPIGSPVFRGPPKGLIQRAMCHFVYCESWNSLQPQ